MDVGRRSDLQEDRRSDRQSLSSNYRYCSQSRKMSIGILVDSISNAKTQDLQEPGAQTAETGSRSKKNSVKDRDGHSPLREDHTIVEPRNASPWVSTRSFNPKISPAVADQDTERTPSFPSTRGRRPRSKLLEKASAAHSLKFFAAKSGLGSNVCRQKSVEDGNADNAEHVENLVRSTEQGVRQEKEQVQNKDRTTETGARESLRIKLWEILGDVSSPNKNLHQSKELHPDQERNGKQQSPIEKINLNSDTIESDSQTQSFTRPVTRSLAQRKASTRKQGNKNEATKSINRKDCQQHRILPSKGDLSVGSYGNFIDGSLPCKRDKIMGMSSGAETNQGVRNTNVAERQQSEKSRSIPAVKKTMLHKNKVSNNSSSTDRRNDAHVEPKKGTKNTSSFEFPCNAMTDQRDVQPQTMVVEVSKKNLQEDTSDSLLKRKRNTLQPQKGTKNSSSFEIHFNAMTNQTDVQPSKDVEALKKNLQEDTSDSLVKRKKNSLLPKKVSENNSSFQFRPNAMADQRDVEQSMDVEASKKNLLDDFCDSLLIKKRNTVQPKRDLKNNSSFEFPPNAMTDQRDVDQSMDVEASKRNMLDDISNSLLTKKRNTVQPKRDMNNNSSFELPLHVMTDQRDVEQSRDVEASKKNPLDDISNSLLIKKKNTVKPKRDMKNNSSFELPLHVMTDQRDVQLSKDFEASKKNLKEEISHSLLKKKRISEHDHSAPPSKIKSRSSLQKSKQEELDGQSLADKIFNRTSILSFKDFLGSESAKCRPVVQQEPSVGRNKENNILKRSVLVKPNIVMDEDSYNQSKSLSDETESESSEDESHKDCKESEELSPKIRRPEKIIRNTSKNLGNDKDVGAVGSSPASDSFKDGVQDASEFEMYMEENQEDGLSRAVEQFTAALSHVKTKLKSICSKRSADILRVAVEEILSRLQNAESLIKTDVGKLTNLSHSKSKQLETRFQEKQEQLLGIHKRFKAEVEQYLQDCGGLIEDLEEHEIELKRSVEKQRAAHKKFISQVEQEISVQLEDAESRITAVQEMTKEKMLQLKLGVADRLSA